jgi:UPF0271 protein
MNIDLNCDLGEGAGQDDALMPLITSANVACGLHAGGPAEMARVVRLAREHGVAVGAHPGYADREHFGRRDLALTPDEVEALLLYQLGALAALARAEHVPLRHVKPHGALYNQAAQDRELAQTVARAVATFSRELILVGLAGSLLLEAGREAGLRVAGEGFPDRAYNPDGTLMSRALPGAVLESAEAVAANAVRLATEGVLTARGRVPVETLCIHGDGPHAVEFARAVRAALSQHGFSLAAL